MDTLNKDIILYICEFLSENDIMCFLSSCASSYKYIQNFSFNEFHIYSKVYKKSYYDNFTAISEYDEGKLPIKIKKLSFSEKFMGKIDNVLPDSILFVEFKGEYVCKLPKYLTELKLSKIKKYNFEGTLPNTLKQILYGKIDLYIARD